MYPRRAWIALAVCLAGGLAWTSAAAASCDPGRNPLSNVYHDGWNAGPYTGTANCLTGSEADILNKNPFVWNAGTAYNDQSFAYTMLWNHSSPAYAQIGWMKSQDGTRNNFSESAIAEQGYAFKRKLYGASAVGASPTYEMTYSSNTFHFLIDGVDYRAVASAQYGGCDAEQSGEVHNRDSQMPGEVNGHDTIVNARVRDVNGWFYASHWVTFAGDSSGNPPGAFINSKSGSPPNQLEIWDSACIG